LAFGGSAYFIEGKKHGEISPSAEGEEADPPENVALLHFTCN
jgi:hypothetical protein